MESDNQLRRAKRQLQALLQQLVSKQPNDPVNYMCTHLQQLVSSPLSPVEAAVRKVMDCIGEDKTQQDEDAIFRAFELLGDGDADIVPVVFTGIPLNHYQNFMDQLIRHLDDETDYSRVKQYLLKQDSLIVSYPEFKCKVKHFLLFTRFLAVCKDIFGQLDVEETGRVSEDVVDRLLSNLADALHSQQEVPQRIAVQLMAAEVEKDVEKNVSQGDQDKYTGLSYEEFQQKTSELFVKSYSL